MSAELVKWRGEADNERGLVESVNINMAAFTAGVMGRLKRKVGELIEDGQGEEPAEKKAKGLGELVSDLLVPKIIQGLRGRFDQMLQERVQEFAQEVGRVQHVLDVNSGEPTRVAKAVAEYRRFRKDIAKVEIKKTSPFECPILVLKMCRAKRPGKYVQKGHFVRHVEVNKFVCLFVCLFKIINKVIMSVFCCRRTTPVSWWSSTQEATE